jgi:hypothetical protein
MFLSSFTLCNTASLFTRSVLLILSILIQHITKQETCISQGVMRPLTADCSLRCNSQSYEQFSSFNVNVSVPNQSQGLNSRKIPLLTRHRGLMGF